VDDLTRLLLVARDGDEQAFGEAVRFSQAETWRVVCHLVGTQDADDVTQDAYVRAWRALPRFRGDSSGRTWLLSIARRACVDALRRRGRRSRLTERLAARSDPGPLSTTIEIDELIAALPRDRRVAFVLTQVAGCTYEEAAMICGVPLGTIRSRVARARSELLATWRSAAAQ